MQAWIDQMVGVLNNPWAVVGFLGQILFFSRWLVQWIASERKKVSYVPLVFWYISLGGGLILFVYAVHRHDPVFMLGQLVGIGNYLRNIMLISKNKTEGAVGTVKPA